MPNLHLAVALAGLSILIPARRQAPVAAPAIAAESVRRHTVELADDKYEGRGAGYPGERRAAEYIAAEFKRIGLVPAGDSRAYFQEFTFYPSNPVKPWEVFTSRNVIGRIDGADPTLRQEIVVIGAHYDGQGRTGQADPSRFPAATGTPDDAIWNSANDNAASVAALIEVARAIKQSGVAPKRSVLFIAFGAEEHGMAGSMHYIAHPVSPLATHVAMINVEKIGRGPEKPLNATGTATSAGWAEVFKAAQQESGAKVATANPFAFPDSDHYPFAAVRIPAIMLHVIGVPDSHQPSDSADRIDFNRVSEAARVVLLMTVDLAARPQRISFAPSPIPDMGLIGHMASATEADARDVAAPHGGLKVTGVIAGLPAAKAGLQPGDFIITIANQQFRRDEALPALMARQREILEGKHGFSLPMTIVRGKTRLDLTMNLR